MNAVSLIAIPDYAEKNEKENIFNRPFSRYSPSLHAHKERWEKLRSRDLSGGKQLSKAGNTSEKKLFGIFCTSLNGSKNSEIIKTLYRK